MPPKKKFTKEQIIDAAFEIAKNEGLSNITIRKVAKYLGSSIAPIYVNFNTIDELIEAVMQKINELSFKMLAEVNSGTPFLDIGIASLRFARDYPILFQDFVFNQHKINHNYDENMGSDLIEQMKGDEDLDGFSNEELMTIFMKMRIFTTGLSIMVAGGLLPEEFDEEMGIELMKSMANDVITSAYNRKNETL